jgi:hypothetical protein
MNSGFSTQTYVLKDNVWVQREGSTRASENTTKSDSKTSKTKDDKESEAKKKADKVRARLKALSDTSFDLALNHAASIVGWGGGGGSGGLGLGTSTSDDSSDDFFDSVYNRDVYEQRLADRGTPISNT